MQNNSKNNQAISKSNIQYTNPNPISKSESRSFGSPSDDIVNPRKSHRLQQAIHESRHQYHDQETGKAKTRRLQLHGSTGLRHLGLHRHLLPGSQLRPLPGQ